MKPPSKAFKWSLVVVFAAFFALFLPTTITRDAEAGPVGRTKLSVWAIGNAIGAAVAVKGDVAFVKQFENCTAGELYNLLVPREGPRWIDDDGAWGLEGRIFDAWRESFVIEVIERVGTNSQTIDFDLRVTSKGPNKQSDHGMGDDISFTTRITLPRPNSASGTNSSGR